MLAKNLSEVLVKAAEYPANRGVLFESATGSKHVTYRKLLEIAQELSSAVLSLGADKDTRFLLHFDNHYDNITWFWAVVLAGYVPAVSTPLVSDLDARKRHLDHLHTLLDPLVLTSSRLVDDFCGLDYLKLRPVEELSKFVVEESKQDATGLLKTGDDLAALMLTSGSTGNSKAVMLRHGQMLTAIRGKSQHHDTKSEDVFLNWIGFDHVANLTEIHLHAMNLAAEQIQVPTVDMIKDPLFFLELLAKNRVAYTFAPNFFLANIRRALLQPDGFRFDDKFDLSTLRALISGGEANVVDTCAALSLQLKEYGAPADFIRPGFGMTETCAGSIYNNHCPSYDVANELEFASLGHCIPGINMRVVDQETGEELGANQQGFLQVCGPVVFSGYYNNPQATAESIVNGWFQTGDMAYLDSTGALNFTGRAKDSVNVNGVKYFTQDLETDLDDGRIRGLTPGFTAVFPHRPKGHDTEVVVVVYLPSYANDDIIARVDTAEQITKMVFQHYSVRPYRVIPLTRALLQLSTLGKLSRAKLRKSFEAGQFVECETANDALIKEYKMQFYEAPGSETERTIHRVLTDYFQTDRELGINDDIFDLGVTSVELLKLKFFFEEALGVTKSIPVSVFMTNPTIKTLAQAIEKQQGGEYDPVTILQPNGDGTPLWCIHPGGGEVLVFMKLATYITDRRVYGVRARGLDGEEVFTSFDEMVATYVSAIRATQPQGPYAIVGYSYGGNVGFEVAKGLEAAGCEVQFLAALDQQPRFVDHINTRDWIGSLLFLSHSLGLISEEESNVSLRPVLTGMPQDDALDFIMQKSDPARLAEMGMTRSQLENWTATDYSLKVIAKPYEPSGCTKSGMHVFYAKPPAWIGFNLEEWMEGLSEWNKYIGGGVQFHLVDGSHLDLITAHVSTFQKKFKSVLKESGL
ncbi:luciferin 4-monooxygenase [Phyllosticta capitalensis]|uniref:Luciferin 4-monooxygenase n=1 Tax=Phyllosticta capitalensis TaxID=121624 RepID=A0ABR1YF27_9PEZI